MEMLGHDVKVRELVFGGWQSVCECGWVSPAWENIYFADCSGQEHVHEVKAGTFPWRVRMEMKAWEYGHLLDDGDDYEFEYFESVGEMCEFLESLRIPESAASLRESSVEWVEGLLVVETFDGEVRTRTTYKPEKNLIEQIEALLQPVGW